MSKNSLIGSLVLLILFGMAYRLWPILAGMPALANFFITEDGYLMLTVARNMAIGEGMSVSNGTIPTNGIQPMIGFFFAVPYLLTEGDKITSLIGVHLIHALIALAALFAIRAFAARILTPRDLNPVWPWAVAILWFLGPILLRRSMNGLETGLYTLMIVLTLLVFARVIHMADAGKTRLRLGLGVMCGLTVLARNDAVFLVAGIFATWAVIELIDTGKFTQMLARLVPPGLLSIVVAAPWLVNNYVNFGSIVPVSGTAQNMTATFGQNLPLLPAKLFEAAFPMLPIPNALETATPAIAVITPILLICLVMLIWRVLRHGTMAARALVIAYLLHGVGLGFYYGFTFGAPHFLGRYMAPLAPLLIVAVLAAALEFGRWINKERHELLAYAYTGIGILVSLGYLTYLLSPGVIRQGHEQVIAWASENVPEEVWVGAEQTGTLGYWHDRTYNLDGKVNPEALAARLRDGHVLNYITGNEDIQYVIDWAGIGNWVTHPKSGDGFADAFELIYQDYDENLSVIKRR